MAKELKINLNGIEKVKKFVNEINKTTCDCTIVSDSDKESNRYIIDAKSIMGIFSLNLDKPLTLKIHTDDEMIINQIENNIKEFKI